MVESQELDFFWPHNSILDMVCKGKALVAVVFLRKHFSKSISHLNAIWICRQTWNIDRHQEIPVWPLNIWPIVASGILKSKYFFLLEFHDRYWFLNVFFLCCYIHIVMVDNCNGSYYLFIFSCIEWFLV